MTCWQIREINPESDCQLVSILCEQLGYPVTPENLNNRLIDLSKTPDLNQTFVMTNTDNKIYAVMHLRIEKSLQHEPRAEIAALVVDQHSRGQSLGDYMLKFAEQWATTNNLDLICLRSGVNRTQAHKFYKKFDYEQTKTSLFFCKKV